jgi:transcriptional regulator with PAS, ATPase and Fis domain
VALFEESLTIHDSGPRAQGSFIEVNCAAIPETMLEAELFGFEAGAFTDAKRAKAGLFEAASGGTLFLDEVDALPLVLQGKLLTAIESKRVRRLGAVTDRVVDVKLIAATNAVLSEVLAEGRFRADLYHRLAVVVLTLPPLRQRGDDILVLAQAFLQHYTAAHGIPAKRLSTAAEAWLQAYAWPGTGSIPPRKLCWPRSSMRWLGPRCCCWRPAAQGTARRGWTSPTPRKWPCNR